MKKYLPVLFLLVLIVPSVALASWWNPLNWFDNWTFDKTSKIQTFKSIEQNEKQFEPEEIKEVNDVFYIKIYKDKYKLGENITIELLPQKNITLEQAHKILGSKTTFKLIRPDGSIKFNDVDFPTIPMSICDPIPTHYFTHVDCPRPTEYFSKLQLDYKYFDGSFYYEGSEGEINQVGQYQISVVSRIAPDLFFTVEQSKIASLFIKKSGLYSVVEKEFNLNGKSDLYEASYGVIRIDGSVPSVGTLADMLNNKIRVIITEPFDNDDFNLNTGTLLVKEYNQNIYYYYNNSNNENNRFQYVWRSDDKVIRIIGSRIKKMGSEEKALLEKYLKKYPSSL